MPSSKRENLRILLTVQHPGHVHFFKYAYRKLRADGHETEFVARSETVVEDLFSAYGFDYTILGGEADRLDELAATQLRYEVGLYRYARRFRPDVIAGIGGVAAAHVARLVGARSVVFTDTEKAILSNALAFPFADLICTPDVFWQDFGVRQYRYPSYHELAYLSPRRFTPDPSVLDSVGIAPDERFVVFRVTAWNALHDIGQSGIDYMVDIVEELEAAGARVLISSSVDLPSELEPRRATVEPHRLHDLLAYASLFVGEGGTTATESAVLGTPAVLINTIAAGTLAELEERYGLLFGFHGADRHREGLSKAIELFEQTDSSLWERRRQALLDDKCDTTSVVTEILGDLRTPTTGHATK